MVGLSSEIYPQRRAVPLSRIHKRNDAGAEFRREMEEQGNPRRRNGPDNSAK